MDKLTEHIPNFRISERTKNVLEEMADIKKRRLTEFIRITLDELAEAHKKTKKQPQTID